MVLKFIIEQTRPKVLLPLLIMLLYNSINTCLFLLVKEKGVSPMTIQMGYIEVSPKRDETRRKA